MGKTFVAEHAVHTTYEQFAENIINNVLQQNSAASTFSTQIGYTVLIKN
jgi:hypothetical protein